MRHPTPPPAPEDMKLAEVLNALSDPVRLALVRQLADGLERKWSELRAPVAKSTLSHHLKALRGAGVTATREIGTRCFVTLRRPELDEKFPGLLTVVLAAADTEGIGDTFDAPAGTKSSRASTDDGDEC
ncbi:helix-turn-helix domain-containing protein [Amycolatopsis rhabdoformis]|uniref:Helix-turn-helix domain-containing protein n=1 Tax=Amycolatopsis rhabdoformis TaxID=1448059 RepID=A0ABZ1ILX2_9PSEU|nr:helix-turn-helix domain-containing protein [Amycolatopsis rhabdoformis]WSE34773.1 helix-turn-helix domain-containing protein [Amycolatopsis rhabdoformis]